MKSYDLSRHPPYRMTLDQEGRAESRDGQCPAQTEPRRMSVSGNRRFSATDVQRVMLCIYNGDAVFDWDENNLRKIRAHRITRRDVEYALSNSPILIYEQNVGSELRFVYYGETDAGRLLAVVLTEREGQIRVVTAYKLDAGQKKDYLARRLAGE